MLLNEFLKEHKKVEDLEKDLRATIVQQQEEIEALTTGLQKVSAQLELSKSAPQMAGNDRQKPVIAGRPSAYFFIP